MRRCKCNHAEPPSPKLNLIRVILAKARIHLSVRKSISINPVIPKYIVSRLRGNDTYVGYVLFLIFGELAVIMTFSMGSVSMALQVLMGVVMPEVWVRPS